MTLDEITRQLVQVAQGEETPGGALVAMLGDNKMHPAEDHLIALILSYQESDLLSRIAEVAPAFYVLLNGEPVPEQELRRFDPKNLHLQEDEPV